MTSNELYHYGVKRRSGRYPWGSGKEPYQGEKFMGKDRNQDIRIKKGTKAYRVSGTKTLNNQYGPDQRQTYISLLKSDHMEYIDQSSDPGSGIASYRFQDQNGNDGRPYSLTLTIDTDLVIPSFHKSFDAFIDVVSENYKKTGKEIFPEKEDKEKYNSFVKNMKNIKMEDAAKQAYMDFISSFTKDTQSRRKFIDVLEKQGYNAIIDENDFNYGEEGFGVKSPVIVFDKKSLKTEKSVPISKEDADYFRDKYWSGETELDGRDESKYKKYL